MQDTLKAINVRLLEEFGVSISMGVGVHTGKAYVGNMGSEELLNYTLIGDNVNLASRLVTRAGVDRRDYVRDRSKNGTYGHAGQYLRFFVGDDQHEIMTGVRYLGGQAERSDYSYDGWEASASLNLKLPWSLELLPSISYAKEYYNGPATALETEKRKDERIRAGMGVVYRIDKDWTLETFYQYTKNNSKSELYEYDRHLVTTGIAWNF